MGVKMLAPEQVRGEPMPERPSLDFAFDQESYDSPWTWVVRALEELSKTDPYGVVGAPEMGVPVAASALSRLSRAMKAPGVPFADLLQPTSPGSYALKATPRGRLADALEIGLERPVNWSEGHRVAPAIGEVRGVPAEQMANRFHAGWGATSPRTQFLNNTDESLKALADFLEQVPFQRQNYTMGGSKVPNLNRAYSDLPLLSSGHQGKTEAMSKLMAGHDRAPIDIHTLDVLGASERSFPEAISGLRQMMTEAEGLPARMGLDNTQIYQRAEQAVLDALRAIASKMYTPVSTFAHGWEGARAAKGLPYYGGVMDILEEMGLLAPKVMGDPAVLREATRNKRVFSAAQRIKGSFE